MTGEVLISKEGKAGRITLNNPKGLHALNQAVCEAITSALLNWRDDDAVEFILVDHMVGSRGFCVGADVSMLAESGKGGGKAACAFFQAEYRLTDLISRYPKPYVAIMDGVTKGGGLGLSIHGSHQIATERTVVSMSETGIGLCPDVGGTWFLSRLPNELGTWLALTGAQLKGMDAVAVGFATHYCDGAQLPKLKTKLIENGLSALEGYVLNAAFSMADREQEIKHLFSSDCANVIKSRLERGSNWAKSQATKFNAKSPLSTKIALRQMRTGRYLDSIQHALRLEYRIATRLVRSRNFHEGVRAMQQDKDYLPYWKPASMQKATYDAVAKYFTPMDAQELYFLEL